MLIDTDRIIILSPCSRFHPPVSQHYPADPHFCFRTERNTAFSFISGRHGMHMIAPDSKFPQWEWNVNMTERLCCCPCRRRSRLYKGLWRCLWLSRGRQCSRPSGECTSSKPLNYGVTRVRAAESSLHLAPASNSCFITERSDRAEECVTGRNRNMTCN